MVKLDAHNNNIEKLSSSALKAAIYNLDHKKEIPTLIKVSQRIRKPMAPVGAASRIRIPRRFPLPTTTEMSVVSYRELQLPEWVRNLQVFIEMFLVGNVTVEADSRLIIERSTTHVQANNFTMHRNSRVIQKSPQFMLSVRGTMIGMP